jgi:hypothetical protein
MKSQAKRNPLDGGSRGLSGEGKGVRLFRKDYSGDSRRPIR